MNLPITIGETAVAMIEEFQCCGCVCGGDINCGSADISTEYGVKCNGHVAGTMMNGFGPAATIYLGMPKGFNKVGPISKDHPGPIRLWTSPQEGMSWDKFNVPTWAMEHEGHLFVRTTSPRLNITYVDVIKGGKMSLLKGFTIQNVGEFIDSID